MNNKQKTLKERIAEKGLSDLEKFVDNMNGTKKRGRKPRAKKEESEAIDKSEYSAAQVSPEFILKSCINSDNRQNAIRIIEEEVGKNNLVRIAVRYLYNAIGGENA